MFRYIVTAVVAGLLIFFWFFLLPYFIQVTCPNCGGKGIIRVGLVDAPCPYCQGRGKIADYYRDKVLKEMEDARTKEREKEAREATAIAIQQMGYPSGTENQAPSLDEQPAPAQ